MEGDFVHYTNLFGPFPVGLRSCVLHAVYYKHNSLV